MRLLVFNVRAVNMEFVQISASSKYEAKRKFKRMYPASVGPIYVYEQRPVTSDTGIQNSGLRINDGDE